MQVEAERRFNAARALLNRQEVGRKIWQQIERLTELRPQTEVRTQHRCLCPDRVVVRCPGLLVKALSAAVQGRCEDGRTGSDCSKWLQAEACELRPMGNIPKRYLIRIRLHAAWCDRCSSSGRRKGRRIAREAVVQLRPEQRRLRIPKCYQPARAIGCRRRKCLCLRRRWVIVRIAPSRRISGNDFDHGHAKIEAMQLSIQRSLNLGLSVGRPDHEAGSKAERQHPAQNTARLVQHQRHISFNNLSRGLNLVYSQRSTTPVRALPADGLRWPNFVRRAWPAITINPEPTAPSTSPHATARSTRISPWEHTASRTRAAVRNPVPSTPGTPYSSRHRSTPRNATPARPHPSEPSSEPASPCNRHTPSSNSSSPLAPGTIRPGRLHSRHTSSAPAITRPRATDPLTGSSAHAP